MAPANRKGLLDWVARGLVIAGTVALGWSALQLVDADLSQRAARRALEAVPAPARRTDGLDAPIRPRPEVVRGAPLGELAIPRLRLSAIVLHGSDAKTLRRGLGHIENTAMPGAAGNVGIAGHRDSFFRPLRDVRVGDDVLLETPMERLHYRVTSLRVVGAHEVTVLDPTPGETLTLVTCYPFGYFGHAPDRFVVRAARVGASTSQASLPLQEAASAAGDVRGEGATVLSQAASATRDLPLATARRAGEAEVSRGEGEPLADDTVIVREAIDRFRMTYNARLVRRNEVRPDGPLVLQPCLVTVERHDAIATCESRSAGPGGLEPTVWLFSLQQTSGRWEIRSITRQ